MMNNKPMATNAKTQTNGKKKSVVSLAHRQNIVHAYYQFYRAFLLKNLLSGMTLGAASHNAMQLVRAKIATMDKNNPVTKYLVRINARHAKRIAKRIMTNKYRDARATTTPETRARLNKLIPTWTRSALLVFGTMTTTYKPKTIAKQVTPKPGLLLQVKLHRLQNQRTAA